MGKSSWKIPTMFFFQIVSILISIAFFTLLEVKLLGYIHIRIGPNKVGMSGYLQPFSDFIKLFSKSFWYPNMSNVWMYYFSPFLALVSGFLIWVCYISNFFLSYTPWGMILFFCLSSTIIFFMMLSGWSSGSTYSAMGSFRTSAQAISYEVIMIFVIFALSYFSESYNFFEASAFYEKVNMWLFNLPIFMCWMISCLAESGRAPFDFSEGESELVSGFNTEYMGGMFAFIFIAEYSFMMFLSSWTCLMFFGGGAIYVKSLVILMFFIMVRGTFPRFRFDLLMHSMWKIMLPVSIGAFLVFMSFSL